MNQTEDFRKNAPAPLAPRSINLPTPSETVLPNGLKVVVIEDRRLPIVSFRLGFRSGSAFDPQEMPGLGGFVASMLTEGTKTRTSKQIAEEVEKIGGSLGANTGADNTIIAASALSNYSTNILSLMADVTLNPSFPEDELALNIQNTLQNLEFQRSDPSFLAHERAAAVIYGEHPYSRISATPESVINMTQDKLVAYHRERFVPNNAVFIVVGDVDREELLQNIEQLFGDWKQASVQTGDFPAPPTRNERAVYVVDRPGSAQSNIILANIALDRHNPDYFPVLVMNQVLGGGASSRLFMNLREEKGYTYGAYSSFDMRRMTGTFEATAEVRSDVTGASLEEFFTELEKIRSESVPAEELQDIKNYLTGVFPLKLETQEGLTNQIVAVQMYDLPPDYLATYREKINEVTAEDVQRVAREYIKPDKMAVIIVGDASAIKEQITPYAEKIEFFDASGNRKEINKTMNTTSGNANGAEGVWNLTLSSPQGDLPVTLTLTNSGGNLGGSLSTPIGDGSITGGTISGNEVNASASLDFQGQAVNITINGTSDGNTINGNVSTPLMGGMTLPFTGTKAA